MVCCMFGCAAILLAGCGGGAEISGTVTYKGENVTCGSLTFLPEAKEFAKAGKPAAAGIKEDGTYSVKNAVPGKHKVVFTPSTSGGPTKLKRGELMKPAPYRGLTLKDQEVELKEGPNTVDLELVPEPKD